MNSDHEDRILEAGLEEVLGGQYPPDLSAKILQALETRRASAPPDAVAASNSSLLVSASLPLPPPVLPSAEPAAPPVSLASSPTTSPRPHSRRRPRSSAAWLGATVAASLVIILVTIGVYVGQTSTRRLGDLLVGGPEAREAPMDAEPDSANLPEIRLPDREGQIAEAASPNLPGPHTPSSLPDAIAVHQPQPQAVPERSPASPPEIRRGSRLGDPEVIAFVNQMLAQGWQERGVSPSPPADDTQWCERVYKRLVGRGPTGDEMQQFFRVSASDRRSTLVDRLLASDEYARHWSEIWADTLVGPSEGEPGATGVPREGLERFLYVALRDDEPYDQLATELICATGGCDPDAEDFNGAANFLAAFARDDHVPATDRVARVFLGKQFVCARCHDHPGSGWDQQRFWELNAFFRQMRLRRQPESGLVRLDDQDFFGETGVAKDAEIFYRDEDGRLRAAYPEFESNRVSRSGLLSDVNRRRELARVLVASPDFAPAVVNRIWAELLEYGFVEPVDDAGPHNPPSHPELLRGLSEQLAAHDFHLDGLVRWIVLSRAFEVSDQPTPESWMDTPETGGRPLFARYYGESERPADLYKSLMLAVRSRPPSLELSARTLARRSWTPSVSAMPQIIDTQGTEVMAGPRWLDLMADSGMARERKVEHVFLSVLDRQPTAKEKMAAKLVLADRMNDQVAIRELWQILCASRARPH